MWKIAHAMVRHSSNCNNRLNSLADKFWGERWALFDGQHPHAMGKTATECELKQPLGLLALAPLQLQACPDIEWQINVADGRNMLIVGEVFGQTVNTKP